MNNNFLKYLYLGMFIAFTTTGIAQVMSQKVGTNPTMITSSVALEVESTTKGFLPPRMTNEQMSAIVTPAAGLMVYCTNCIPVGLCVFDGIIWKQIPTGTIEPPVIANCSSNGFSGLINTGVPISGATFSTTITNNSLVDVGPISFSAGDLVLSGVDAGLVVGTPSPASATISSGGSQLITYPITGTPASIGTLTGTWTNGSFTCSNTREVGFHVFSLTSATDTDNQIVSQAEAITPITYSVTGVSNVTVTGLPAGVTYIYNSGTLTISGSPTVPGVYTYTLTTVPADPDASATGMITVGIPDKMFGVADNSGDINSHKFLYMPVTGADGRTWLNNNLGAHYANVNHASYNPAQQATSATDYLAYGSLFQWGRKPDGHELINHNTDSNSDNGPAFNSTVSSLHNNPDHADFITASSVPQDWRFTSDDTLWSAEASENNPCPVGYRLPTITEFNNLVTMSGITNSNNMYTNSILKLTLARRRNELGLSPAIYNNRGAYSTSSVYSAIMISCQSFSSSGANTLNSVRAFASSVRCIKD